MARGNQIVVTADPQGKFDEGTIDDTSKPGTIMQTVAGSARLGGRFHFVAAAVGTDGKQAQQMVLLEDNLQGKTVTDAYVAGTRCRVYTPIPGEECNVLVGEAAGTGNTVAVGDRLILDAEDGILVPEAGTPQETPWVALEAETQQAGSQLLWCRKT